MLIPFVHRFLFFLECGGLPPLLQSESKLSHSKAGVNACIKALTMVR
jgi:hypothetical protein